MKFFIRDILWLTIAVALDVAYKVIVRDVAKGNGLPLGSHIDISTYAPPDQPLLPQKGDIRTFFLRLNVFGDNKHALYSDDIRFAVQPESMFKQAKSTASGMRGRAHIKGGPK